MHLEHGDFLAETRGIDAVVLVLRDGIAACRDSAAQHLD